MLSSKQQPNLPVSMYPDPEVAPQALVYRINDDVVYSVDIAVYEDGKWVPYGAKDVQLEFVMLNPYVRTFLTPAPNGTFSVEFKVCGRESVCVAVAVCACTNNRCGGVRPSNVPGVDLSPCPPV